MLFLRAALILALTPVAHKIAAIKHHHQLSISFLFHRAIFPLINRQLKRRLGRQFNHDAPEFMTSCVSRNSGVPWPHPDTRSAGDTSISPR